MPDIHPQTVMLGSMTAAVYHSASLSNSARTSVSARLDDHAAFPLSRISLAPSIHLCRKDLGMVSDCHWTLDSTPAVAMGLHRHV
jgi:hypothetical protein